MSSTSQSSDEVLDALSSLRSALDAAAADEQAMADEALRMRRHRPWRGSWQSTLPAPGQPNLLSLSTRALATLSTATSRVRTALARALRAEGLTVSEIAALFGVSHQRVSELLARRAHVPRTADTDGTHSAVPDSGEATSGVSPLQ